MNDQQSLPNILATVQRLDWCKRQIDQMWAMLRRRSGSSGGASSGALFAVNLTQTGGSAGSSSSPCSFTYTVKAYGTTTTLATGASVLAARPANVQMTAASKGMAFYDSAGTLRLMWADEKMGQTNC